MKKYLIGTAAVLLSLLLTGCGVLDTVKNLYYDHFGTDTSSTESLSSVEPHAFESFDALFSSYNTVSPWYRTHLTEKQQAAEEEIFGYLCSFSSGMLRMEDLSNEDLAVAQYAVRHDYPALFWIPTLFYTEVADGHRGIRFSEEGTEGYFVSPEQAKEMATEQDVAVRTFLASLPDVASDYEIELAAHDYILSICEYDTEAAEDKEAHPLSFTAYGALIEHKAVCEGYSKAFQLLLNAAGVECFTVTGDLDGGHMWNMAKIGGEWYQVDLTADDQAGGFHLFFNRTDEFMQMSGYRINKGAILTTSDHYNLARPNAESTEYLYYRHSGYIITEQATPEELHRAVAAACPDGEGRVELYIDESVGLFSFNISSFVREVDYSDLPVGSVQVRQLSGYPRYPILMFAK